MKVKGTVGSLIFVNSENGYTVLELETENDEITAVGILPAISVGEELEIEGEFVHHSKFGPQFSIKTYVISTPHTPEGVIRYLSSGLVKGVGVITAQNIVKKFGVNALKVIENDPAALSQVKGISSSKALQISQSVGEVKRMQSHIMFLQGYEMSVNLAVKIYNVYKDGTKDTVVSNPYKLIDDVDGVGFITADRIAKSIGIETESKFRIRAGVVYVLKENGEKNGNTFLYKKELRERAIELLNISAEVFETNAEEILETLQFEGIVNIVLAEEGEIVALSKYFQTEKSLATRLIKLKNEAFSIGSDVTTLVEEFQRVNKIFFHEDQKKAIHSAIKEGVSVITGGPGTGKTTIVKCICDIFNAKGLKVLLATPTGRASKRLSEATGIEAGTIHRVLGVNFVGGRLLFNHNDSNPLNADVIIVDEVSMADCLVFNSLTKAIKKGCRLILVGDKDQLPSVGAGNVLSDIVGSGLFEINYLTYIYRQGVDSLIISNAHLVNEGKMPIFNNQSKDFFFITTKDTQETAKSVVQLVDKRLPSFTGIQSKNIQVLAPLKMGNAGVDNLNILLQEALNPASKGIPEIKVGKNLFRLGDKVMQTQNDYELEWYKQKDDGTVEFGDGVFNGEIGFVTSISSREALVEVTFDENKVVQYSPTDLSGLMPAYAVTVHKSQGSEFDVIVLPLSGGSPKILTKNLLYTAITRAKQTVVVVGNKKYIAMMVKNNYIVLRNTLLKRFLNEENNKYNMLYINEEF